MNESMKKYEMRDNKKKKVKCKNAFQFLGVTIYIQISVNEITMTKKTILTSNKKEKKTEVKFHVFLLRKKQIVVHTELPAEIIVEERERRMTDGQKE